MATKQYTGTEKPLSARARSQRRRETGGAAGGGTVTVVQNVTTGAAVTAGDGHTHANKSSLDQLSVASGYVKVGTAKASAGYADEAGRSGESTHASTSDRAALSDRAVSAQEADHAATSTEATHAVLADLATRAENLTADSSDWATIDGKIDEEIGKLDGKYLSKVHDDTAQGKIRFEDLVTLVRGMMLGDARLVKAIQSGGAVESSDTAIMTAAKQIGTFLRKDTEDETRHLLRLLGGALFTMLKTPDYLTGGLLGTGLGLYQDVNGQWCVETDRLYVRVKAVFNELEIRKLSYAGGNILLSPAGSRIINVVEQDGSWRCYVKADDGETGTMNWWRVGDQARCQTFNVKAGVYQNVENRYYWRLVTGVGDDYVDLSKSDCDSGSDAPQTGDSIVQLGNRTDSDRQHAILLATCDAGAPSITQYSGINSYSLVGTIKTRISPGGNVFTGDFYLTDGRSLLAVTDGKIASVVSETVRTQGEKDNWLQNGSFADHLAHWEHDAGTSLYTVGDDYVQANVGALSVRGEGACWVSDGGHPACYIRNSHLIQRCADYASVPSLQTDGEGKKLPVPVRLVLYYQAVGFCHLTISFDDEQKSGEYAGYTSLLYDQDVAADSGYHMLEVTGLWNGTGDLDISVDDGPALIRSVSLWLDEYTYYESRIEQTARSIRLSVTELSQTVAGHTTSIGQLEIRADSIESSVSSIRETAEGNSTAIATLTQTAEGLSSDVRSLQSTQGTHTSQISSIQQTASAISTRVSAIEGDYVTGSDLTQTANRLSAKISEVSEGREGRNLLPNSLINETSTLYGFGRRSLRLKAGETYTLSACGLVPYAAYSDGMELQVHIWRVADANDVLESGEEKGVSWRNSRNVHIEYNEGLSMTRDTNSGYESAWVADRTGEYFIEGYMAYKNGAANGGSRTHGVTLLWVKVEQGASATGWVAGADDAVNLVNWIASPLAVNSVVGETGCGTQSAVSEAPFGQVVQIEHYANSHWQRRFERRAGYSQLTGRAVTFWMVCRSLDGYGRWVTDSDGTERRVRLCFGDVNKVDTIDSWTSDFTDLGGGWRKYWCVRYMDEDLSETVGLCHTMGRWRVYAVGIVSGCVCPGIRDIMEQNGLLSTGIDIEKKEVTVTADNFKVRNNAGVETMLVDANGKLSASLIEAVQIVTQALQSGVITAGEAIVRGLKVGGNAEFAGVVRATTFYRSLEIGTSINAVWKYTFSDGSYELTAYKEWDIGETWDVVDGVSRVIVKIEYWGNRGTDIFYARTEGQVVSIPDPEESEGRTIEIYNSSGGSIVVHASNAKACTTTIDGWGGSRSGLFIYASNGNASAGDLTGSMGYLRLHAGWRTESGSSVPMLYWNILEYRNTDGTLYTP